MGAVDTQRPDRIQEALPAILECPTDHDMTTAKVECREAEQHWAFCCEMCMTEPCEAWREQVNLAEQRLYDAGRRVQGYLRLLRAA